METGLKNKNVVVTGGTRGIGRAIVEAFAKEGANVWFCYHSNKDLAESVVSSIKKENDALRVEAKQVNVSVQSETNQWIDEILSEVDSIDVLVNNAGMNLDQLLLMQSHENFSKVVETNLYSVFHLVQKVGFHMYGNRSGAIVNIASISGTKGSFGQTNYSSSKAAIIGFTKSASLELGKNHVRINAIAPGFIDTSMTENLKKKEKLKKSIPLNRFGRPEEVANLVVFLASDLSSYITGETVIIDGGYSV